MPRAARSWFQIDAAGLAQRLIGQRLVRVIDGERLAGIIVETEAYLGIKDRASHTFGGRRTDRNEPMYARGGTSYVYFTYGMHHCMNISAGREGDPVAVLIRALEPEEGLDRMHANRVARHIAGSKSGKPPKPIADRLLCSGPGRVCAALDLDRADSGLDMTTHGALFVEPLRSAPRRLGNTGRIGVENSGAWARRKLRWYDRGSASVSGPASYRT